LLLGIGVVFRISRMTRRSRILSFGSAALLVVAGAAGAIAFSGTLGQVLALALIGLGFVLATGLVFLEVGLSEDKERARTSGPDAVAQTPSHEAQSGLRSRERRRKLGLERMRGNRRRLR
jgi:hypothetical protein